MGTASEVDGVSVCSRTIFSVYEVSRGLGWGCAKSARERESGRRDGATQTCGLLLRLGQPKCLFEPGTPDTPPVRLQVGWKGLKFLSNFVIVLAGPTASHGTLYFTM